MDQRLLNVTFAIITSLNCLSTQGQTTYSNSSNVHSPRKAEIGLYIKYLTIEEENSTFQSDAYYWITIKKTDNKSLKYYKDSLSVLEYINGVTITEETFESKWIIKEKADTFFYRTGLMRGTFSYNADFRKYPQDIQELGFIIESPLLTTENLKLEGEEDKNSSCNYALYADSTIQIRGRHISSMAVQSETSRYNSDFGDKSIGRKEYSRYKAILYVERENISYLLKILVPNILLLVIAYLVFFIPAKELEVAVGCTVTSLLASIALKWTIDSSIPNVGYTTSTDKMFYLFYFLITLALVQTVITYNLQKIGRDRLEKRLDMVGRFLYPIILAVGLFIILT
jgi:hypothetical protein